MSANFETVKPNKGIAIGSLILGIVSIPTFGLFVVGAITSITLGVIALSKIHDNPQAYGGKKIAVAGITTGLLSLVLIGLTSFSSVSKLHRQTAAINTLRTIHQNQAQFSEMKGRFGTLDELVGAGLVDEGFLSGKGISGFRYAVSDVSENTYCAHADRTSDNSTTMDFVVCEDGLIRFVESMTKGTVKRGEGTQMGTKPAAPDATP